MIQNLVKAFFLLLSLNFKAVLTIYKLENVLIIFLFFNELEDILT
jgi:hypothetical protein